MKLIIPILTMLGFSNVYANSQLSLATLSQKIVELRLEVENLNSEYLANKGEMSNELRAKGARTAQLEVQIGQEEVRKKQGTEKIAVIKDALVKFNSNGSELKPFVLKQLKRLELRIEEGIPFQVSKRLKEIKEIREKLESKVLTSEVALGRLWAQIEDEMRLNKENALHRQVISLNGEERLATVAKIGMMMMYFHTTDNIVGYIDRNPEGQFVYVEEKRKDRSELIFKLVDGLKKQIRHGRYDLPLAMK